MNTDREEEVRVKDEEEGRYIPASADSTCNAFSKKGEREREDMGRRIYLCSLLLLTHIELQLVEFTHCAK